MRPAEKKPRLRQTELKQAEQTLLRKRFEELSNEDLFLLGAAIAEDGPDAVALVAAGMADRIQDGAVATALMKVATKYGFGW